MPHIEEPERFLAVVAGVPGAERGVARSVPRAFASCAALTAASREGSGRRSRRLLPHRGKGSGRRSGATPARRRRGSGRGSSSSRVCVLGVRSACFATVFGDAQGWSLLRTYGMYRSGHPSGRPRKVLQDTREVRRDSAPRTDGAAERQAPPHRLPLSLDDAVKRRAAPPAQAENHQPPGRIRPARALGSAGAQADLRVRLLRVRGADAQVARPVPVVRRVEHAGRGARPERRRPRGARRRAGGRRRPVPAARGQRRARAAPAHRDRRARHGPRRRPRARLARPARRLAGDRQVDADEHGPRPPRRGRARHALRLRRGVGGADPPARRAPGARRARGPRAGRDRPRRRARPCSRPSGPTRA